MYEFRGETFAYKEDYVIAKADVAIDYFSETSRACNNEAAEKEFNEALQALSDLLFEYSEYVERI